MMLITNAIMECFITRYLENGMRRLALLTSLD